MEIAGAHGTTLPAEPDAAALEAFLRGQRAAQPETFPDLSLSILKLLGRGEYVAESPGRWCWERPLRAGRNQLHALDRA